MNAPFEPKKHSPSEFEGREHIIFETIDLKGFLSLSDLRNALVALAQNHYLSYQYIINNFGANDQDAIQEVFSGEVNGIFIQSNPDAPTAKLFWHLNSELSEEEIFKYIHPRISKSKPQKVKKYKDIVKEPKKYQHYHKPRPVYKPDPRGESNRIANFGGKKKKYESITGDGNNTLKPRDRDDYHWSAKTSKKLNRALKTGELRKDIDYFD